MKTSEIKLSLFEIGFGLAIAASYKKIPLDVIKSLAEFFEDRYSPKCLPMMPPVIAKIRSMKFYA